MSFADVLTIANLKLCCALAWREARTLLFCEMWEGTLVSR
jgi:hypothetical protein